MRDRFGDRFQIGYDPAYAAERGRGARADEPWLQVIPCKHGHVFPWGGELLAFSADVPGSVANRLARLSWVTVCQEGSDGLTVTFPATRFDEIAQLAKPLRRRRLTPENRNKLVLAGERTRILGHNAGAQSDFGTLGSVRSHQDDHGAVPDYPEALARISHRAGGFFVRDSWLV